MNLSDSAVYYVSGPLHSGKTTRLREWSQGRSDVGGVFQPVIDDVRHFVDIRTGTQTRMDAVPDQDAYLIGKYRFAKEAFAWAGNVILERTPENPIRYLIIDEIGPLEMHGDGLHGYLQELLAGPRPGLNVVLVIRDYLLDDVLIRYGLRQAAQPFPYPA